VNSAARASNDGRPFLCFEGRGNELATITSNDFSTNLPDDRGMFGISLQALALMAAAGSMIDIVIVLALLGVVGTARWFWR
jgi:hypothetical protein